jgi:phospholipase C
MPSLGDLSGNYIGAAACQEKYPSNQPPVPYGPENANADPSLLVEEGFKPVRGSLTEGRYLTFEMNGYALTSAMESNGSTEKGVTATIATVSHDSKAQRWVLHQVETNNFTKNSVEFMISAAVDGRYISPSLKFSPGNSKTSAGTFTITDLGNGQGYAISAGKNGFLGISSCGAVEEATVKNGFSVFSVTYHT